MPSFSNPHAALGRGRYSVVAGVLLLAAATADAAPPSAGSEDYDELMPFSGWIAHQSTNKGGLCCSVSDCRVVQYRSGPTSYEAFVANSDDRGFTKFPGAPNRWLPVPETVIKRNTNPTGQAIACWSKMKVEDSGFYCFFLPEMG